MQPTVFVASLHDEGQFLEADLQWWARSTPGERILGVELARKEFERITGASMTTGSLPGTNRDFEGLIRLLNPAWRRRAKGSYGEQPVAYLGLDDLIAAKKAAGRPQDRLDVERLEQVRARAR